MVIFNIPPQMPEKRAIRHFIECVENANNKTPECFGLGSEREQYIDVILVLSWLEAVSRE